MPCKRKGEFNIHHYLTSDLTDCGINPAALLDARGCGAAASENLSDAVNSIDIFFLWRGLRRIVLDCRLIIWRGTWIPRRSFATRVSVKGLKYSLRWELLWLPVPEAGWLFCRRCKSSVQLPHSKNTYSLYPNLLREIVKIRQSAPKNGTHTCGLTSFRLTACYLKQEGQCKRGYRFGHPCGQETLLSSMKTRNIIFPSFDFPWYWRICMGLGLSGNLYGFLYVYKIKTAASHWLTAVSLGGLAERTRFELVVQVAPYVGLANQCTEKISAKIFLHYTASSKSL